MVQLQEQSRKYYFPGNETFEVTSVRELVVSKSGGHRLTRANGKLVYIPPKWFAIKIKTKKGWQA